VVVGGGSSGGGVVVLSTGSAITCWLSIYVV
jgi:hypothetical protein